MKWYFWVLIIVVIAVIGYFIWKNQMNKKANALVEGSECTLNATATRTAGPAVDLGVIAMPIKGIVVNGVCVKK